MAYIGSTPISVQAGGTAATDLTINTVLVGGGASVNFVGPGSAGQLLKSSGSGAPPVYTTATFPATATGTGTILRADGTNWVATTATYPATTTVSQLLYSSSTNVIGGLTTANNGLLVTSNTGVPSVLGGPGAAGKVLQSNTAAAPSFSTATYPSTATGTGTFLRADGTNWVASTATIPNTAGTAGKVLISDGTNFVSSTPTFPNASASSGKFIRSDGTNWIASTPTLPTSAGTSGKVLQSDGTNYVETTATYPSTATGTGTILRADGTNWAATTATYPATTTINQILYSSSANVVGGITTANSGVLTTNGSGVPSITSTIPGTAGGVLILIQKKTYSDNDPSVTFTSIPSYAKYMITFDNIRPKTAGSNLLLQYSTDNGGTYISTNYTSGCNWNAYNSATLNNVNATTAFIVAPNISGGTTPGVNAIGYLFNTNNNVICYSGAATFANNTGSVTSYSTATGSNTGFTSFNALKILFSSGNLMLTNAATITLYGISES
jgi:hypothetical protein